MKAARRFYAHVDVAGGGREWAVRLDARPIKTPGGRPLRVPTRALAELIAQEWRAQTDWISPDTLPLTRLAGGVLDGALGERAATEAEVLRYAQTDLVCFIARDTPGLADVQEAVFAPLRDWAAQTLGVVLETSDGLAAPAHPPESLAQARTVIGAFDDWRLAPFAAACALLGSFVLAVALAQGRLDPAAAFAAARLDEDWQEARWGVDAEAAERAEARAAELSALGDCLAALSDVA